MPIVDLGGGVKAFVCVRGRTKFCYFCGRYEATRLCDYPVAQGRTCDRAVCDRCATVVAPEVDYCPDHKAMTPPAQQTSLTFGDR